MSVLEQIDYRDGDLPLTGWMIQPEFRPRAALIVYPTIANVNAPVKRRARMLAEAGYIAMVADLYGKPVEGPESIKELSGKLRADPQTYRSRLRAAADALSRQPDAAGLPMGAIGYCLGGQAALEIARDGADLSAVVSFHGLLDTQAPAKSGAIKARILVCHGDADPLVPREQVMAFWKEMDVSGADWHFHSYSGVRHGFTDPGSDERELDAVAYDASADRQSWSAMLSFFNEAFE